MERSKVLDCFLLKILFVQIKAIFCRLLSDRGFSFSKFGDIYDEEFFVSTLSNDVRVVDTIPEYLMERFDHNMTNVYNFRVKAWSPIQYYRDSILPKLLEEK
jgi:hypothetical protein